MSVLDNFPLATFQAIVGTVLVVVAYLNGDLNVLDAFAALGLNGAAAGAIGVARNGAGRGVK